MIWDWSFASPVALGMFVAITVIPAWLASNALTIWERSVSVLPDHIVSDGMVTLLAPKLGCAISMTQPLAAVTVANTGAIRLSRTISCAVGLSIIVGARRASSAKS